MFTFDSYTYKLNYNYNYNYNYNSNSKNVFMLYLKIINTEFREK